MKKYLSLLSLVLFGCGGGSSPTTSPQVTIQSVVTPSAPIVQEVKYFVEDSDRFPDLRYYYDKLCGNLTQVGHFLHVDINGDGRKDIVMSLVCDLNGYAKNLYATPYEGPVLNTLLILKQKADKTFYVANTELFGKELIQLNGGGTTGLITYGDYNNDGRVDIAFAYSKEDGRAFVVFPNGTTTWDTYPQALMSTPNGFELQTLPLYFNHNYIHTVKNQNNQDELIVGGSKFVYRNNQWVHIENMYQYAALGLTTVGYQNNNTQYVFTDVYDTRNSEFGLSLYKLDGANYKLINKMLISKTTMVEWYNPMQKQYGSSLQPVISINNKNYLTPAFINACYAGTKNNVTTMYALFNGIEIKNYVAGQRLTLGLDFKWEELLGRIVKITITNESITDIKFVTDTISYPKEIVCSDVNNDGNIEFFVNRWHTYDNPLQAPSNPAVFINKGETFTKVSDDKFTPADKNIQLLYSYMLDMNQDGMLDLVYTTHGIVDPKYTGPIKLQVYSAKRILD